MIAKLWSLDGFMILTNNYDAETTCRVRIRIVVCIRSTELS
jgi:hypothetical protein